MRRGNPPVTSKRTDRTFSDMIRARHSDRFPLQNQSSSMPKSLPVGLIDNEMISTATVGDAPEFHLNENSSHLRTVAGVFWLKDWTVPSAEINRNSIGIETSFFQSVANHPEKQ